MYRIDIGTKHPDNPVILSKYDPSHQSTLFVANKAVVILRKPTCGVAVSAIIHFHPIPRFGLVPCDVHPLNISAVTGYAILLVNGQHLAAAVVPMACAAIEVSHLDMCNMREIDAVGLPGIGKPWDFLLFSHIFGEKLLFLGILSQGRFGVAMAFHACFILGNSGKGAVIAKRMAVETPLQFGIPGNPYVRIDVDGMTEADGLLLA